MAANDDRDEIRQEFDDAVNMTPKEIEDWLDTDESNGVGEKSGGGESTGHESGRRIVAIKHKQAGELTEADLTHMRKVVGYVHRHLKQGGPKEDEQHSAWRYSLMNWGHDPEKGRGAAA